MGRLSLGGQLCLHAAHQRVAVGAVYRNACGLIGDNDVIVLIYKHGGRGGAVLQLLICQEELDAVSVLHPGGEGLLFAVQLDLVLPQGLVQPPHAEGGKLIHQIFVHPHGQQAFYMQFFHFVVNS